MKMLLTFTKGGTPDTSSSSSEEANNFRGANDIHAVIYKPNWSVLNETSALGPSKIQLQSNNCAYKNCGTN